MAKAYHRQKATAWLSRTDIDCAVFIGIYDDTQCLQQDPVHFTCIVFDNNNTNS